MYPQFEHLEKYIKKHIMDGEQLIAIKNHLMEHGWPHESIKIASHNVLKDKQVLEKLR